MMTRGGKRSNETENPESSAAMSGAEAAAGASADDKLDQLASLVKSLMQSQTARDQQIEKESARQEVRWKNLQQQFRQLQTHVEELKEERQHEGDFLEEDPHTHDDDGDSHDDGRKEWAVRLVPLLTGKARSAYVLMDIADSHMYDKVKDAVLTKYEITADTYRRRFQSLDIHQGETPKELYVRLKDMFYKWVKPETSTVKNISELMIMEQFLRMVNPDLEVWIRERAPTSAEEAASLAEVFLSARTGTRRAHFGRENFPTGRSKSDGGERGGALGQTRSYSATKSFSVAKPNPAKNYSSSRPDVRCFQCNRMGHTQYTCPATIRSKPSLLCSVPRPPSPSPAPESAHTVPVLVNGQRETALLDTGSFKSVVLSSLVPRELWGDAKTKISCIHGDEMEYPVAEIYLTIGGQTFLLPVALASRLPYAVILGLDVPTLTDLVSNTAAGHLTQTDGHEGSQVKTQNTTLFQKHVPIVAGAELSSPICSLVTTRAQAVQNSLKELPFYDVELEVGGVKPSKSRAQRRKEKFLGSARMEVEGKMKPCPLFDFDIPSDISAHQRSDPTLKPWFDKVTEVEGKK
ncbi:uncharacterized protein LOC111605792 [Xiphophorus maculatus]|uniref:uncharacterized protein LOC111605792 n=1 Tax=Xiphophorus maculatus TaxID=8083 RepID=UPI000C6E9CC3|nr:uncharacterized protein LOC111605792 [Xiphophorus maculatus]